MKMNFQSIKQENVPEDSCCEYGDYLTVIGS